MAEICMAVFSKVIDKPIDLLWNFISKPVTFVFSCKKNVDDMKKKADDLKNKLQTVEEYVQYVVDRRGEAMGNDFQIWLTKTNRLISETDQVFAAVDAENKCFFGVCFNPVSRYKLSKKAAQNSETIAQQLREATGFRTPDSYVPAPVVEVASAVKGFEDFSSRRAVLEQIMEELQETRVNKMGVYGMPGAGKSMLLQEVKRKAEESKLFEKVVLAKVSKEPDFRRIQDEIALGLGMDQLSRELSSSQVVQRITAKLKQITEKGKVLVIFDDVWSNLDLAKVGVLLSETGPSGERNITWKILFTSRDSNVLRTENDTRKEFSIGGLQNEEARHMFKKIVGDRVESDGDLQRIANGIVEECGGLPLALSTLANALKHKSLADWRSALQKLQNPSSNNFFNSVSASIYTAIEVSYNHLQDEELKQTLLLCSMMPQNSHVQDLLKYSAGLGLFSQATTIEQVRDHVLASIGNLKSASLLIDSFDNECSDIHDLVRDVAISIAHRDHCGLLMKDNNVPKGWPDMEVVKDFKWIYLQDANVGRLPDELGCPLLTFCFICNEESRLEIPENFFKGMQRLKVLDLTAMHMPCLPSSICFLKNLHTFCLDQSSVRDLSVIGELKSLEILSLSSSDIEELPVEIRELTRLQMLDMSGCDKLTLIPPHVLENLSSLEELYLANNFDQWKLEGQENQLNASLAELNHLKKLTTLEVRIGDVQMIPEDLLFQSLTRYKIFIGDVGDDWDSYFGSTRLLKLHLMVSRSVDYSVKNQLFKMTEELRLEDLNGVRNLVEDLYDEGFHHLKYLCVSNSPDVLHIVKSADEVLLNAFPSLEVLYLRHLIKLENIFRGWFTETSFNKLREITVSCCDGVKNLFSSSITRRLSQLQKLQLIECNNMEWVVDDTEQGRENCGIVDLNDRANPDFGEQLLFLKVVQLPNFSSFNSSSRNKPFFNDQVVLPNLEELQLSWINVSVIWQTTLTTSCVENLTILVIEGCHKLEHLFSYSLATSLKNLQELQIRECEKMRAVIFTESLEENETLVFPKLHNTYMDGLQDLVGFFIGSGSVEFPSLKRLAMLNCSELQGFVVKSINKDDRGADIRLLFNEQVAFPGLEIMEISHLKHVTKLWHNKQHSADSFCKLKSLTIKCCDKLSTVFSYTHHLEGKFWTSLEELQIGFCNSVEFVFLIGESIVSKTHVGVDTQLRVLHIANLPRLEHVWNKDPQGTLSFKNLETVKLQNCQSLKNAFPASVAKNLKQLQKLKIQHCGVEEIVALGSRGADCEEVVVGFEFPQLINLWLADLSRLKYFYPRKCSVDCPMLKKFNIFYWNRVAWKRDVLCYFDFPVELPLFSLKKVLLQLENISLSQDNIAMISEDQFQGNIFSNIKAVRINYYDLDESVAFPVHFLQRLLNLEKLELNSCGFRELFSSDKSQLEKQEKLTNQIGIVLSRIRELKLFSLYYLRHIWSHDSSSFLPNIEILKVKFCDSLISLSTSLAAPFKNLTTLEVYYCKQMTYLISASTVQSLMQLKRITVVRCDMLTELVECNGDHEERGLIISFGKLEYLTLKCLTRLESFCTSENLIFKFPSLDQLIVDQCPNLKTFYEGDIQMPVLYKVNLSDESDKGRWVGDLNTTIQTMYTEKVGFVGLESLKLSDFPELIEKWHTRSPQEMLDFRRLKRLEICNCNSFTYLLTPLMASSLVQLWKLVVKNCGTIKQVIKGGEADQLIILPQLNGVHLESCSDLTSFYIGRHSLQIPTLVWLTLNDCQKMATFSSSASSDHDENVASQYFFTNEVSFPGLEKLEILYMGSLNKIWDSQLDAQSFCQLNTLTVQSCKKLLNIFPSTMLERIERLNKLNVWSCDSLEEIVEFQTHGGSRQQDQIATSVEISMGIVFPNLVDLDLDDLPILKAFSLQVHAIEFPSLKRLEVNQCNKVLIFASEHPSFRRASYEDSQEEIGARWPLFWVNKATFSSLEELKLEKNGLMEEIWGMPNQVDYLDKEKGGIVFTRLKYLQLNYLPRLVSFCSTDCDFGFPSLKDMTVMGCPRMKSFSVREPQTPELQNVRWSTDENQGLIGNGDLNTIIQEMFAKKVGYSSLKELKLSEFQELVPVWKQKPQEVFPFKMLISLEVSDIPSLRYLLTPSMVLGLEQLQKFKVINCDTMEQVIAGEEGFQEVIFPLLETLWIENLPKLSWFCSESSMRFPSLTQLTMSKCPLLKTFIFSPNNPKDACETTEHICLPPLFDAKVAFPQLEILKILFMKSLNKIWESELDAHSFCRLKMLTVQSCEKLLHIFSCEMIERLERLDKLNIWSCGSLEEIIESQIHDTCPQQDQMESSTKNISFQNLVHLYLYMLPKLKCFSPQVHSIECPLLKKIEVTGCNELKIFASEHASFQSANEGIQIHWPLFWVNKTTFSSLEELKLERNDLMEEIWHEQCEVDYCSKEKDNIVFTKLKYLRFHKLPRLASFSSSNSKFEFPILEDLMMMGCPRMQFFTVQESLTPKLFRVKWTTDEEQELLKGDLNSTIQELFTEKVGYSGLGILKIAEFPELIAIWNKELPEILSWGKLTQLEVCNVIGLRYVLTPSMVVGLVQLHTLKVVSCHTIERVVAEEQGSQELFFPKLNFLWLEELPRLQCFCSGNSLKFASLTKLRIIKCPLLKTFVCNSNISRDLMESNTLEKVEDNYSTPLFDSKVAFPRLEQFITRYMENLNEIWDAQLGEDSFYQLNHLRVEFCDKLLHIFPSSMLGRLKRLGNLEIDFCNSLEKVFESHEGYDKFVFPDLKNIYLHMLPKLKCFFPLELIVEFPLLKKLEVNGCDQVQTFASECARFQRVTGDKLGTPIECPLLLATEDSFPSLEEFKLRRNGLMEKVWSGMNPTDSFGEVKGKIVFPKLKHLHLQDMPRLACVFSSNYNFEFPSLEGLTVMGCLKMQCFSDEKSLTPKLQSVKRTKTNDDQGLWMGDLNTTLQELFNQKVGYSTLDYLKLVEFSELIAIWKKTPQDILSVRMLTNLEVCNVSSLTYLLTPSMALDLVQLERLKVINCETMEEVITEDGCQDIIFPKLKYLWLKHLPKLTRFHSENYLKFPNLWQLMIEGCSTLKTFISSSEKDKDTYSPALFNIKVALPKLERLIIDRVESLNKIWEDQFEADAFCKLNYVRVESCGKLLNIFPYGMPKRLQKLDKLRIRNCSSVEEIFASKPQVQKTTQPAVVDDLKLTLVFPNLTRLELYMLPKLKCVFPRIHTFQCPLVKLLEVIGCNEVQLLASECPSFQIITEDNQLQISPQFPLFWVTKGTFPSLAALRLGWNDIMKDVWCGQDPGSFFPKLMLIELINFPEQSAQIPSFFIQSLPDFSELVVNGVSREISQEDKASRP